MPNRVTVEIKAKPEILDSLASENSVVDLSNMVLTFTDEQRKQFEANFLECSPMSLPSIFTRDSVGGYENDYLQQRWRGWVEGQRARDVEVQRLLTALENMVVEFDPNSENEIVAHKNAVMLLAEYLPEKETTDAD